MFQWLVDFCPFWSFFPVENYSETMFNKLILFQVCHHESIFHCFHHDLLLCIRCSCLLANTSLLLDCALCPDNEATDCAYDQVQVCPVQLWKAGETSMLLNCHGYFCCVKVTQIMLCSRVSQVNLCPVAS